MATHHLSHFVDMRRKHEPANDNAMTVVGVHDPDEDYPYGLCLHLGDEEVAKLDLDLESAQPGATIHLCCMAKVKRTTHDEKGCCVELQITHIACEDEGAESEEAFEEAEDKGKGRYAESY